MAQGRPGHMWSTRARPQQGQRHGAQQPGDRRGLGQLLPGAGQHRDDGTEACQGRCHKAPLAATPSFRALAKFGQRIEDETGAKTVFA